MQQSGHKPESKNVKDMHISIPVHDSMPSPGGSLQMASPIQLDSPTRKKKMMMSRGRTSEVEKVHSELNSYIDVLDNKVVKLVEKHEAQFLVAYRNHIKKVRQQMEEIRNKALSNANSTVSQTQKIQALEKQLTIFREQSLKLFEKVNEKQGIIYTLKTRINELETEKGFLDRSLRQLTKRNKQLQGLNYETQSKKSSAELAGILNDKQFFISRPQQNLNMPKNFLFEDFNKTNSSLMRSRPHTTALNSKGASIRSRNHSIQINQANQLKQYDLLLQKQQILNEIDNAAKQEIITSQSSNYLKLKIQQILKEPKILKVQTEKNSAIDKQIYSAKQFNTRRVHKSFLQTSKNYAKRSELQEYFFKSIEAVRKQITRRRGLKSTNFYSEYANMSVAQFKKVDFFRLLELLLSNDKIINAVRRAIFEQASSYK